MLSSLKEQLEIKLIEIDANIIFPLKVMFRRLKHKYKRLLTLNNYTLLTVLLILIYTIFILIFIYYLN